MEGHISYSLILSFNFSQFLITEKLEYQKEEHVIPRLYKISKRVAGRERIINKFRQWINSLLESIENDKIDNWLKEESSDIIAQFDKINITHKEIKKLERFSFQIKKISRELLRVKEYYPLSFYLSKTLERYPEFVNLDFKLFCELGKEKYKELLVESLEQFPEKPIFLGSFMISIYLINSGQLTRKQELYLTSVFHKFLNLVEPIHYFNIKFEEEELKRIPHLVGREL